MPIRFPYNLLDNPEIQENFEFLEDIVNPSRGLMSTLPPNPTDGEEIFYQNAAMAAEGVIWRLRYREASPLTHKWEFIGGPAIITAFSGNVEKKTEALEELPASPKLTVPLTGIYDLGFSIRIENLEAATRTITALPLINGATGLGGVELVVTGTGGNFWGVTFGLFMQRANLTAAQVLSVGVLQTSIAAVNFQRAYLTLQPVAIG